jgi:hypothetical protein
MFIKNSQFTDEDSLFEALFDFEIGIPSAYMQEINTVLKAAIEADKTIAEQAAQLDEEGRMELYDDIWRENVVRILMERFKSFKIYSAKLYGVGEDEELLYTIDMY